LLKMNVFRPALCTNLIRSSYRISQNFHFVAPVNLLTNRSTLSSHLTANAYSSASFLEAKTKEGIFSKIRAKFENSKARLRGSSVLLYENIADGVNYAEFFIEFNMPDTFNSWFLVTELHCWLLLTRVMQEGPENREDGRFIRNCLVEAMWADVQARAKRLSTENPSAGRQQIASLAEQFQATLISYDEGLMSDDKILASALWRRLLDQNFDDYTKLEQLVQSVRKTALLLDNMTRNQLIKPEIKWEKLND